LESLSKVSVLSIDNELLSTFRIDNFGFFSTQEIIITSIEIKKRKEIFGFFIKIIF
jgi:hypothetical protein